MLQDDRFDAIDSLIVCPFTPVDLGAPLIRVRVEATGDNGLEQDSFLMVEKITTVRRSNARHVLGGLEFSQWSSSNAD